jgi:hypothetical protein
MMNFLSSAHLFSWPMISFSIVQAGVELCPFTCSIALRACVSTANLCIGQQLHLVSIKKALSANIVVANALIDLYCNCAHLLDARRIFYEIPEKNLVTWNTLDCWV